MHSGFYKCFCLELSFKLIHNHTAPTVIKEGKLITFHLDPQWVRGIKRCQNGGGLWYPTMFRVAVYPTNTSLCSGECWEREQCGTSMNGACSLVGLRLWLNTENFTNKTLDIVTKAVLHFDLSGPSNPYSSETKPKINIAKFAYQWQQNGEVYDAGTGKCTAVTAKAEEWRHGVAVIQHVCYSQLQ